MKSTLSATIITLFICSTAFCQIQKSTTPFAVRRVRINFVAKDSVNLLLNEEFDLIEDSCAQIVRYAHLNMKDRKFTGNFKDVLRTDTGLVLTEGSYNSDGLKDGRFVAHYMNGTLQAKGSFKNNSFDGHWDLYYDDGKPQLSLDAVNSEISIADAWDKDGKKVITGGKGPYLINMGMISWKGKLLNGKPDGTWRAYKTDDATTTTVVTEEFKNGVFKKGNGPLGDYTDASRLVLADPNDLLPFTRTEKLRVSAVPCNGVKRKHIVGAQYSYGLRVFNEEIKNVVSPYISKVNISTFENEINIQGYVNEYGDLEGMRAESTFRGDVANGLIQQLSRLPRLTPATVDGKPTKQKIAFKFTFTKGLYTFSYQFLPITLN